MGSIRRYDVFFKPFQRYPATVVVEFAVSCMQLPESSWPYRWAKAVPIMNLPNDIDMVLNRMFA